MTVFSDKKRVLERVNLKQVQALLTILNEATFKRTSFIEIRYKERALNFNTTIQFLRDIGWITEASDELLLTDTAMEFAHEFLSPTGVGRKILDTVIANPNPYGTLISQYLAGFNVVGNEAESRPAATRRLEESGVRNFLMELGVVFYDHQHERFVLTQHYAHLYVWAKNVTRSTTKLILETKARHRELFGAAAEDAIFEYEKTRVGEQLAPKVQHISRTLPFSSYDIRSFTVKPGETIERFIEVKAVSAQSYEFFWTQIELEAAKLLRDTYYLYLLPSDGKNFDFSSLLVLENAYEVVYKNHDEWSIEENVVLCRKK